MSPRPITQNTLFYGDNLPIMREYIPDESIDLIYLDPPFNSNRSYNVLFKDETGTESEAQMEAFDDTWHWGESAERIYHELVTGPNQAVGNMIAALRQFISGNRPNSGNQMMAYLVMMAARLVEMHRILKPSGSLYLHCDPTASHYLKIILDTIFDGNNFVNEIVWKRSTPHGNITRSYGAIHDVILFYSKSEGYFFSKPHRKYILPNGDLDPLLAENVLSQYVYIDEASGRRFQATSLLNPNPDRPNLTYVFHGHLKVWRWTKERMEKAEQEGRLYFPKDGEGIPREKRYLDEQEGLPLQDIWDDVAPIPAKSAERLGYPTQKPVALLERIIQASSNEGDFILDPFSGCGTAIAAAQKLNRRWIGIDITHLAIAMHKSRLKDMYGLEAGKDYQVIGEPTDLESARALAREDRYQFQWWALSLINARPIGGQESGKRGKKGSDQGIDGVIPFVSGFKGEYSKVVVQVKSGTVKSGDIRDLHGVLEREKDAAMGLFLTLESPTREMTREAVSAGFYTSPLWQQDFPKIQILTIEEILNGARIQMPPGYTPFKIAEKVKKHEGTQTGFEF